MALICRVLAWENSQHSMTPPLFSPQNDVWETSVEFPCWWNGCDQLAEYNSTICEPDLGSDRSSVWNFCLSSDIISQRKQCWRRSMWAVFSGYKVLSAQFTIFVPDLLCKGGIEILTFVLQSCFLTVYIFVWTWIWFLILFTSRWMVANLNFSKYWKFVF